MSYVKIQSNDTVQVEKEVKVNLSVVYHVDPDYVEIGKLVFCGNRSTNNVQSGLTLSMDEVNFLINSLQQIVRFR